MLSVVVIARFADTHEAVPAELRYYPDDPFAVALIFNPGTDYEVAWTFARSLLELGQTYIAGIGDVRIWPRRYGHPGWLQLAVSSEDGQTLFDLPADEVTRFLRRSYRMVRPGMEDVEVPDPDSPMWRESWRPAS